MGLCLGKVVLLSGCGGSSASVIAVPSAKEYAEGARKIEENNKKHIQAALAARKTAKARAKLR
jgi:hypothetical protein